MMTEERLIELSKGEMEIWYSEIQSMAKELLALRKAFSEPIAFTAQSNLDGFGGSVGYMWPPGNEKPNDVALYRKPSDI